MVYVFRTGRRPDKLIIHFWESNEAGSLCRSVSGEAACKAKSKYSVSMEKPEGGRMCKSCQDLLDRQVREPRQVHEERPEPSVTERLEIIAHSARKTLRLCSALLIQINKGVENGKSN